ncbi:VanW family protein [Nonomuraea salmonea]|uniref:VanW family protein n=1 Tax=Nonomuraea salmonea TaxID=46181 RepID=UPI002FE84EF7
MYNAAYFAGFDDVEHQPLDYFSSRFPAGRDATLLYPEPDLKWRNDSENGVLIKTASTPTSVTITLWGVKRYDKIEAVESEQRAFTPFRREVSSAPDCVPTTGEQGFTIDVTRVFHKDGKILKKDKKVTTKYRPPPSNRLHPLTACGRTSALKGLRSFRHAGGLRHPSVRRPVARAELLLGWDAQHLGQRAMTGTWGFSARNRPCAEVVCGRLGGGLQPASRLKTWCHAHQRDLGPHIGPHLTCEGPRPLRWGDKDGPPQCVKWGDWRVQGVFVGGRGGDRPFQGCGG